MFKLLISCIFVLSISFANESVSLEGSLEEDVSFLEEDVSGEMLDDSMGLDEDINLNEDSIEYSAPTPTFNEKRIDVKIDEQFRSAVGDKYVLKKGISIGNSAEEDDKSIFVNEYQLKTVIKTSDTEKYLFRFRGYLAHTDDKINKQYTDESKIQVREAYKSEDFGSSSFLYGIFLPENGKLIFNSTSDVLTQSDSEAHDTLSADDSKNPIAGMKYQKFFDNSVLTIYFAPLKPKNSGTEYTIYQEDLDSDSNSTNEDRTSLAPYSGFVFNASTDYFDYGVNAFYWFDVDNKISYSDTTTTTNGVTTTTPGTYKEEASSVSFISFDINADIWGDINLKSELTYFNDKNIYHFFKNTDDTSEFETYEADLLAFGLTFQKEFGPFNILPNYTYQYLKDVPKDTNILNYENRVDKAPTKRNLIQHKYALALLYSIDNTLDVSIIYSQAQPVKQRSLTSSIVYMFNDEHSLGFRGIYSDTEKQKTTDSKMISKTSYIEYKYKF